MTDTTVAAEVVRASVLNTVPRLREALGLEMHGFLMRRTPDLLAAFTRPFDRAAATLTAAAARLGDVSLDDTAAVVAQGGRRGPKVGTFALCAARVRTYCPI